MVAVTNWYTSIWSIYLTDDGRSVPLVIKSSKLSSSMVTQDYVQDYDYRHTTVVTKGAGTAQLPEPHMVTH